MDLAGEDFAKAVDEALRDIRDMEDAQRIIREVAEESCHAQNNSGRRGNAKMQKGSKSFRESDRRLGPTFDSDKRRRRAGRTEKCGPGRTFKTSPRRLS